MENGKSNNMQSEGYWLIQQDKDIRMEEFYIKNNRTISTVLK